MDNGYLYSSVFGLVKFQFNRCKFSVFGASHSESGSINVRFSSPFSSSCLIVLCLTVHNCTACPTIVNALQ